MKIQMSVLHVAAWQPKASSAAYEPYSTTQGSDSRNACLAGHMHSQLRAAALGAKAETYRAHGFQRLALECERERERKWVGMGLRGTSESGRRRYQR